jgi:hypothetical protein
VFRDASLAGCIACELLFLSGPVKDLQGKDHLHYIPGHFSQAARNLLRGRNARCVGDHDARHGLWVSMQPGSCNSCGWVTDQHSCITTACVMQSLACCRRQVDVFWGTCSVPDEHGYVVSMRARAHARAGTHAVLHCTLLHRS